MSGGDREVNAAWWTSLPRRPHQRRGARHPGAYSDEMRKSGASYQEMFKKVKNELVRKYKAVL